MKGLVGDPVEGPVGFPSLLVGAAGDDKNLANTCIDGLLATPTRIVPFPLRVIFRDNESDPIFGFPRRGNNRLSAYTAEA